MRKNHFFTLVLSLIFISGSSAYADYDKALELFKEGKHQESLSSIAEVLVVADDLKEGSSNYKLRYLAGHNHWKLKNYKNALTHLKRCIQIKPASVNAMLDVSMILLEQKQLRAASSYAYRTLKIDKKNALAYYILGKVKYIYKNYWGAKALFEKAQEYDQDFYDSYNYLGMTLMNLKRYSKANTAFSMARALNPGSVEILNNLAVSYIFLNKKEEAINTIEDALKIDPENEVLLKNKTKAESLPEEEK